LPVNPAPGAGDDCPQPKLLLDDAKITKQDKPSPLLDYQIINQMIGLNPSMTINLYIMVKVFMPKHP
jgi:hypothetical protein